MTRIELINRRRVGVSVLLILGLAGLWLGIFPPQYRSVSFPISSWELFSRVPVRHHYGRVEVLKIEADAFVEPRELRQLADRFPEVARRYPFLPRILRRLSGARGGEEERHLALARAFLERHYFRRYKSVRYQIRVATDADPARYYRGEALSSEKVLGPYDYVRYP